ncbi:MAG: hypothetical protein KatS3mg102_0493 [Planctomycetota bacterium]|nr:MAG: hypothetical protein KatS3mg102_0493 [Planctomycetota bacterium]
MESWFLADLDALGSYFGPKFQRPALPANPCVERVAKHQVLKALRHASHKTPKGAYEKARDGFELLSRVDPARLTQQTAPYARRFLDCLTPP